MKRTSYLLFVLGLTLSACGTRQTQSAAPAQTSTASLIPTKQTPIPPIYTVTPLPTIPTFTPTFDASTVATVTPAKKAECSAIKNDNTVLEIDLTNDGVPELIINDSLSIKVFRILMCDNNEYKTLYSIDNKGLYLMDFEIVEDANKNGVPEVLFSKSRCELSGCSGELKVVEWNDNTLTTVLYESELGTFYDEVKIEDLDNDGINEFFWSGNTPLEGSWNWEVGGPWRSETRIYKWNGTTFAPEPVKYSLPKFRFQALQDSDRYILENKYADALSLYQEVIDNNGLEWWSPERNSQQHDIALTIGTNLPTPTLIPPDPTEYPRLAAYAYYRIMLLHLAQGQEAEAAFTYQTLQETFGNDPYAAPYVKMATEFWKSYQSTRRMYVGCAAAIQYAVEHPEILIPLGSDYHGWQSHIYEPADVCPFR